MTPSPNLARLVFRLAGITGLLVLAPMYFLADFLGEQFPPAITQPIFFYGFVGVAIAWQLAFLVVASDPVRYRALMPVAVVEKLSFGLPMMILLAQGRVAPMLAGGGAIDLVLGVLFAIAYVRTPVAATSA
jgi:hypothetical protein